jgi:hypothetical protein
MEYELHKWKQFSVYRTLLNGALTSSLRKRAELLPDIYCTYSFYKIDRIFFEMHSEMVHGPKHLESYTRERFPS